MSDFLVPYIQEYDAFVFTMMQFVLPALDEKRVRIIAPAIDPFATKNMELSVDLCKRAIADCGVDPNRPLLLQVSRFDPWKDPMGVIEAYRLVKKEIRGVQLALIGAMAGDDPEGWQLLDKVQEESALDPDLFVFTNVAGVGSMEVNVFQRGCDVVVQKSMNRRAPRAVPYTLAPDPDLSAINTRSSQPVWYRPLRNQWQGGLRHQYVRV